MDVLDLQSPLLSLPCCISPPATPSSFDRTPGDILSNNTTYYIFFSLVALTVATVLNVFGLDVGTWLHNMGALAMWIPICIIVGMGAVAWHLLRIGNDLHCALP